MGDGTRIARGLNIVNVAFTILEEGSKAHSILGNYTVAILKASETYDELALGLQDICEEAQDLEVLTIQGNVYTIKFFWVETGNFWPPSVESNLPVHNIPASGASAQKVNDQTQS